MVAKIALRIAMHVCIYLYIDFFVDLAGQLFRSEICVLWLRAVGLASFEVAAASAWWDPRPHFTFSIHCDPKQTLNPKP